MKSNRWMPILVMVLLAGLGTFVGVNAILTAGNSKVKTVIPPKVQTKAGPAAKAEIAAEKYSLAVLRAIDKESGKIGVYLVDEMRETGFSYDLATSVKSVNDEELVISELQFGSVLELVPRDDSGMLSKISVSKNAWDYKGVKNLEIDEVASRMQIGDSKFVYDAGLTVMSNRNIISVHDIDTSKDVLEVRGVGEKILSIDVTTGHGTLDFTDYDDFLGGSIEIGYEVFDDIAENMKYVLREGMYKVVMRNGQYSLNKVVEIKRDRTEVLRVADYIGDMTKNSEVKFNLSPAEAIIYIDGRETDTSGGIRLDYGEYMVRVTAEGYVPWEKVVNISKPKTVMSIALAIKKEEVAEQDEEADDGMAEPDYSGAAQADENEGESAGTAQTSDGTGENESTTAVRTDSTTVISFRKPEGATISFDGRIVGDVPCEMTKVTGEHDITISMDGYESQTYTVDIADDGEDAIFSFPELIKE